MNQVSKYAAHLSALLDHHPDAWDNLLKQRFKIVVTDAEYASVTEYPDPIFHEDMFNAITQAMSIAGDLRDFTVSLGYEWGCNENDYVEIEHGLHPVES